MRKIYLLKIRQHGEICYIGKIDPRELVRVAVKVQVSEVQDAQRPLNKNRVTDIAKYVSEDQGILPNTLTLGTRDSTFEFNQVDSSDMYYIEFPSEESEFAKFADTIDVMDGQHRLYSFLDEYCNLGTDVPFEIGFTIYDKPSLEQRRKIFICCNEKQEKVSGNLLMWFKMQLGMVNEEERKFYNVVEMLSKDAPLKGHIIMSAEKVKNGVKAKEVMSAMKQANIDNMLYKSTKIDDNKKVDIIRRYLFAWQKFAGFDFSKSSSKEAGAAVKMAGLKFMLLLLPTIWNRFVATSKSFTEDNIVDTLSSLATALGVERGSFFTCEQVKYMWRERSSIDVFAKRCEGILGSLSSEDFDPLA